MSRGFLIALIGFIIFLVTLIPVTLNPRGVENSLYINIGFFSLGVGFIAGTIVLAIDKGYSVVFGIILSFISPLGLLVLLFLPDQSKKEHRETGKFAKQYNTIARGYRIILSGLYVLLAALIPIALFPKGPINNLFVMIGSLGIIVGVMIGTVVIATDKGYSAGLGFILGLFSPFGLLVLTLMEDKSKKEISNENV